MSFFIKGKPRTAPAKRKFQSNSSGKFIKTSSKNNPTTSKIEEDDDEEIDSDEVSADENNPISDFSEDDEQETAQDKRLRLAKTYLEEIEKEEKVRAEDNEFKLDRNISKRLNEEYLDSVGKLRKKVADSYTGIDEDKVKSIKHKLQKLPATCLCLSNDDKFLFTGSKTPIVVKWDLKEMKSLGSINCEELRKIKKDHGEDFKGRPQIFALALSTDLKFLAIADMSKSIHICCPITLKHIYTFSGHRDLVTTLVFRKDTHTLYSASRDRSVKVWSLDEMAYVETLFGHQAGITGIDAGSKERVITAGGSDCSVRIFKIAEESQLIYNGHHGSIEGVRLINDENFLSSGDDGSLCIWSAMKKKALCIKTLAHGKASTNDANWISAIATLLNTDLVASGSCDGYIRVWKLGENYRTLNLHFEIPVPGFINSLAFTNDGTRLIACVGQEHRLGRWWRVKEAKNAVMVIPLVKK